MQHPGGAARAVPGPADAQVEQAPTDTGPRVGALEAPATREPSAEADARVRPSLGRRLWIGSCCGHDSRSDFVIGLPILTCALGPDCAGTLIARFLENADDRLDAAAYEVGPAYRWTFALAARRGAAVRVLLDAHAGDGNAATAKAVAAGGGSCRVLSRDAGLGHWKLLVADSDRVAVGTGNLIWRDAPRDTHGRVPPDSSPLRGTREWWTFVSDAPALAAEGRRQFDRAWDVGRLPPAAWAADAERPPIEVRAPAVEVAPMNLQVTSRQLGLTVGGAQIAERLGVLIAAARRRVLVTAPYIHACSPAVRPLLVRMVAAQCRGVDVRILLGADPAPHDSVALGATTLPVAVMDPLRSTRGHAKGAVIDGTAFVGSANWSAAGFGANWEAALGITHASAADYYARALLRDWEVALRLPGQPAAHAVSAARGSGMLPLHACP